MPLILSNFTDYLDFNRDELRLRFFFFLIDSGDPGKHLLVEDKAHSETPPSLLGCLSAFIALGLLTVGIKIA